MDVRGQWHVRQMRRALDRGVIVVREMRRALDLNVGSTTMYSENLSAIMAADLVE